jgi:hypothetical protein
MASQAKPIEAAKTIEDLAAFDGMVDACGSPRHAIASRGMPILQPTDERRRTGSHYTPRSLTAPIVKYALEPAFDHLGPDATPEQVLDLKVCNPAMGRAPSWGSLPRDRRTSRRRLGALARYATDDSGRRGRRASCPSPRRPCCLFGVDKNPRAVDLARLSLWLATFARDYEFTFLDHALKCGDSLVGLTTAQIAAAT